MKIFAIIMVALVLGSFAFVVYDLQTGNEIIQTSYNKYIKNECELKSLGDRWFQIENCEIYRRIK